MYCGSIGYCDWRGAETAVKNGAEVQLYAEVKAIQKVEDHFVVKTYTDTLQQSWLSMQLAWNVIKIRHGKIARLSNCTEQGRILLVG